MSRNSRQRVKTYALLYFYEDDCTAICKVSAVLSGETEKSVKAGQEGEVCVAAIIALHGTFALFNYNKYKYSGELLKSFEHQWLLHYSCKIKVFVVKII